ncbi:MAG TPA: protein kinase [Polyangiaceae bacterium]|nr:protein kinase [Polyangiaceae bacterium]
MDSTAVNPGDVLAGRFVVERQAGAGAMGVVYKAVDRLTGEAVALKLTRAGASYGVGSSHGALSTGPDTLPWASQDAERFLREAQVLAELHHPGIVRYIAHGVAPFGAPFIAMEWLEGQSLADRLARDGLTVAESVLAVRRAAEALRAAHDRGIVHRDLKPSNLFLVNRSLDRLKVIDFGIARLASAREELTGTGVMIGTPGYMAPEQARGERAIDARADVFSLGCVLFKCLTGQAPFQGDDVVAVLVRVALDEAPSVASVRPDIPPELDAIVARMLKKPREERPRHAGEVADELAALGELAGGAPSGSSPAAALTTAERRLICVIVARLDPSFVGGAGVGGAGAGGAGAGEAGAGDRAAVLAAEARRFGGDMAILDGGAVLAVTFAGGGSAADRAALAAKAASSLWVLLDQAPMAILSGHSVPSARLPGGGVVEQGASLVTSDLAQEGLIYVDDVTAGLLDATFDVVKSPSGFLLRGERQTARAARMLLGKPTPCVGRDREIAALLGVLDECASEPVARPVLVTGAPGVGKSRLRDELLERIARRDDPVEVWIGRGDAMSRGSPFGMIAPMIRGAAGIIDNDPLPVRRRKLYDHALRRVGEREAGRVAQFLGELVGAPFPDEHSVELRATRQDPRLMGDQTRRAWEDLLAAECAERPVLLILDDLQWGDLPSVAYIDGALRSLRDAPLMVLALARPEVHELFPRLWTQRGLTEIHLGELPRRACERLVREVLGDRVSRETAALLVERADGNAFYLEELIRAAANGAGGGALPDRVLAMVQARLEGLDPEARRVLRAASVFGREFRRDAVAALLGGADKAEYVGQWLDALVAQEIVTSQRASSAGGDVAYALRHALVREAAYAMLTEEDRRLGHGLAGEWLAASGGAEPMRIAEHFERSFDPKRAAPWFRRAAAQALPGDDFAAVLSRAARGLACGAEGTEEGALRLLEAEAHTWLGSFEEAAQSARAAMDRLERGSALWQAAAKEAAEASGRRGDTSALLAIAEELLATGAGRGEVELPTLIWQGPAGDAGGGEDREGRGPATVSLSPGGPDDALVPHIVACVTAATQLLVAGQPDAAEPLLRQIDSEGAAIADREPALLARIQRLRAYRALCEGDPAAYLTLMEAAVRSFSLAGDLRSACLQRSNVGFANLEIGDFEHAKEALTLALAEAERLGLPHVIAAIKHNLGMALARTGEIEAALAVEREAAVAFAAAGDRRLEGLARVYLARILEAAGDVAKAEEQAASAAVLLEASPPLGAYALAVVARARLARGAWIEALAPASEAMRLLEAAMSIEEGEAIVRLVYAEALDATGSREAARAAIAAARARLLDRASRIRDPDARSSFLYSVPENARTLDLASRLCGEAEV